MNQKIIELLAQLDEELLANNNDALNFLVKEENAIEISTTILSHLKVLVIDYKFETKDDEIYFFKVQKPEFISRLIYHHSIYYIELHKPLGGEAQMKLYLDNELVKLKVFFDANLEFYKYIRTESDYHDHAYFLRGVPIMKLCQDLASYENDHQFCTSHGFILAKTIANDHIEDYINLSLSNIGKKQIIKNQEFQQTPIWIGNKTALVELIYALHCQGVIDISKSGLKNLFSFFESVFKIKLGNPNVTVYEIKERKNGFCRFLDVLKITMVKNYQ